MKGPNRFDLFLAGLAPRYAMRRLAARQTLEAVNSGYSHYGANTYKKALRGWLYRGGSAKEDIEDNLDTLRQRSRDAYMGIPVATSAIKTLRTNVVAGGLMPTPQVDGAFLGLTPEATETLQADILREFGLWADQAESCDADGMDDFYQLQQLAFVGYLLNGDAFALLPMERPDLWRPYGLRVRVVEGDRVCSPDGHDWLEPCEVEGRQVQSIIQGVERDLSGRVTAYWVRSSHPLGTVETAGGPFWTRVAAAGDLSGRRNILHVVTRERAGQVRGVPLLAPVLETLRQMGKYSEAEINAAVIASLYTVFIQPPEPTTQPPGELLPKEQQIDREDPGTIELGPGAIVDLNPGETVQFAAPNHPNDTYAAFMDAMVKQAGGALEIPQELLDKKFSTSYSAARGALNEFWRTCEMLRDWFASDFCQPIYEEWLAEAVARGRIRAPGFFSDPARRRAYSRCSWSGPARTNLNPVDEVKAAVQRVNAGFSTAQEETAQMTGGNYANNVRQRAVEIQQMRRATGEEKEEDTHEQGT